MNDYAVVLGLDSKHLEQLALTLPTWRKYKPSLFKRSAVIFFDKDEINAFDIQSAVGVRLGFDQVKFVSWPPDGVVYEGDPDTKWDNPQRYKMLAGFVHVPAHTVETRYWLKLDTDVVAKGNDDWIDPKWFDGDPGIVAHSWSFTKPPDQIQILDDWADRCSVYDDSDPLNLVPEPGATRLGHKRIISWCCFSLTRMTRDLAQICNTTCGMYKLPVPSQDGCCWYHARRSGLQVYRANMKALGWEHWSTMANVRAAVERVMG